MMTSDPARHPSDAPGFDGVVFDLDGVLVESEHLWEENWTAYSASSGYSWLVTDTSTVQGMSVPEWSGYMLARIGRGTETDIADRVVDGMIAALNNGRIELLPAAATMVETAAARVPIAVASSAPKRLIAAVLAATGLLAHFSATVSSEEVRRGKPSPDVYQEAARRLDLDPTRCLGVEDSNNGIRAAAAAGLTVIALPNPVYPPAADALALCTVVAATAEDVRRYFANHLPHARPAPGVRRGRVGGSIEGGSR
ncbi:MAG: HAD family phosphatase [Chloroflexota bacterium]|nr:HAD family phosphatase [Chloroflexota bacterium]